ncbi:MAG: hydantoinase/oxoprolinase N-terminal domain-containing protein, partial [Halobacteriota archaeon]
MRLGIDVGGTFTDVVLVDETGERTLEKVPTTSPPDRGVVEAIDRACANAGVEPERIAAFRHGTTVATNALLTRSGATTALVTTEGFRDVLEIGRQDRPDLYDLETARPDPLVPRRRRFELEQRTHPPSGDDPARHVREPSDSELADLVEDLRRSDPESIAVCLLHAYADDEHERLVADRLRDALDVPVITSGALHPEFREYERTATTVTSAYLTPVLGTYLQRLEAACESRGLPAPRLMQSNGGITTPAEARRRAVTTVLSGP